MKSRMIEEYKFLRQELEGNRKFVFERPLLIVGATFSLFIALKGSMSNLSWYLPIPLLLLLIFNLWFTFNRLWSSARIVAYIQLVHEGKKQRRWIGWENALHKFRRMAYQMDKRGENLSNLKTQADTYHSMGYYAPIFYFHLIIGVAVTLLFVVVPNKESIIINQKGIETIPVNLLYANLLSLAIFMLAFVRFRPGKVRHGIERNRAVWINVLGHTRIPALFIPLSAVKKDAAFHPGARGARKIVVTDIDTSKEEEVPNIEWVPPHTGEKAHVEVMPDTELAFFNQLASQERHYHKIATEIYMVVEGTMVIEVAGKEYVLSSGDTIIVNNNTIHKVKPERSEFICRVISINCGGVSDKYIDQND